MKRPGCLINVVLLWLVFAAAVHAQQVCSCPWESDGNNIYNLNPGRVGVGTSTPGADFDIRGRLRVGKDGKAGVITSHIGSTEFRLRNITPGQMRFEFGSEIVMRGGGLHPVAIFANSEGDVGIGTTSPQEKLAVDGTIVAREVRVDADPASWPDFVFDEEYRLPPIEEVQGFIRQRGHLPDVPSAAEVSAKGLEVGAFQAQLLRKIEELTLYIIDLHTANETLREELDLMAEEVERLASNHDSQ